MSEKNQDDTFDPRARTREIQAQFAARGDALGWFDALYNEAEGDPSKIPWADLEPNRYFRDWAGENGLKGNGRTALVVGCGLGDDANYLADLGFQVTAFDLSPTAIAWAKKLYPDKDITFEVADLFQPFRGWLGAFDFVLEIYTIQPLPLDWRPRVIDAISAFANRTGEIVVVTRGREDNVEPDELPWPMSRKDLSRFETNGFVQIDFVQMPGEDDEPPRFVVAYRRRPVSE
ncbi:MAG: class I SAM-dependent methyltransferase [Pyrinomonadaceae bacterium]|nr:class I SAM-dependent methyltransferase [Pyrinomonadaceae bacterium]